MRARDVAAAAALAVVSGCANQDAGMVTPAPLDARAPAPEPERAENENEDGDELGLAEYERLLADKETRLRAAGVLLAVRQNDAEEARDSRFAAPPPAAAPVAAQGYAVNDEVARGEAPAKSKRAAESKGGGGGRGAPTAGPPAPPAPKAPSTTASSSKREKNVKYEAATRPEAGDSLSFSVPAEAPDPAGRCQNICDLSAATCDLEGKICDLAARHTDDPRYAELCRRADDDCRQAAEACQHCSP